MNLNFRLNLVNKIKEKNLLAIFVTALLVIIFYVPTNMDEILPYHAISCITNDFSASSSLCQNNQVNFFGISFFKSYSIVGFTPTVFYSTFYLINKSEYSHYFYGLISFILFACFICKTYKFKKNTILIPIFYFPLFYQFIHDTGPIKEHMVSIALIFYILSSSKNYILTFISVFFISLLAIETKPFILMIFPMLSFIALYNLFVLSENSNLKANLGISLISIGAALIIYFFSYNHFKTTGYVNSYEYFSYNSEYIKLPFDTYTHFKIILKNIFSPIFFTNRIYEVNLNSVTISFLFFLPLLLLIIKNFKKNTKFYFLLLAILIQIFVFIITAKASHGHHFVFLHIPILIILMTLSNQSKELSKQILLYLIIGFMLSICQLLFLKENNVSNKERYEIFNLINNQNHENTLINFQSWGGYYYYALYNKNNYPVIASHIDHKLLEENIFVFSGVINICLNEECKNILEGNEKIKEKISIYNGGVWSAYKYNLY